MLKTVIGNATTEEVVLWCVVHRATGFLARKGVIGCLNVVIDAHQSVVRIALVNNTVSNVVQQKRSQEL